MSVFPSPKANAMLVCDYVITEQGTNKKSLIGVFENINAARFPCVHHGLSVYIKMTEGIGKYRFRLELIDLKNDKSIGKGEIPHDIELRNPLAAHELVFNLKGLKFAHAGEYEFRMFANDKIMAQKSFMVSERQNRGRTPDA